MSENTELMSEFENFQPLSILHFIRNSTSLFCTNSKFLLNCQMSSGRSSHFEHY